MNARLMNEKLISYTFSYKPLLLALAIGACVVACQTKPEIPKEEAVVLEQADSTAQRLARETLASMVPRVAEGLELSLWATDSLAPDPIALDIDNMGRIYLTRTNRQKNSEFDIRGHRDWMINSISLQSVEDRRAFLRTTFATERSEENSWLQDLNNDTIHDWRDLTVEEDEVWRLEDRSGDGMADIATRILHDFTEEVSDVAGGLHVGEDAVYVGIAPDLWKLTDSNGDDVLDTKESLATGFMVHIGFGAHGMSGVTQGPDGKIYWGIGDIGASITAKDGSKHHYPNQGVIVRCNPDGSNFEVFARGLRNTHEFVFDDYGNLITSDNDGDHAGESERLVYLVDGSDSGWRTNWQFGKYVDPKNNGYKVWMDEKLYLPRWEGQASYIIPPIRNFHNGPTGMQYNPGAGLGKTWQDKFFLVEFIGDPARSHIWAFDLKPDGAGFAFNSEVDVLSGVLPTGIRFGPDGALYLADWINGWGTKNYGRIWKLDVRADKNDLAKEREITRQLMQTNYSDLSRDSLGTLLSFMDRRIRQKAQFELAKRGRGGYAVLESTVLESSNQMARIHAIWGIGQMAQETASRAEILVELLEDNDPEIVAQSAKILGDLAYAPAGEKLLLLLKHESLRVRFFGAQALGRLKYDAAVEPLLELLAENADQDVYIRHAGVLALSRIGSTEPIIALSNHPNRSLRMAAVLVLRRLAHPEITRFLNDEDPYILEEIARAINDDWSIPEGLPQLAALLDRSDITSEVILRRAINAALRTGSMEDLDRLIAFSLRTDMPSALRGEALATLGGWHNPSVLDRVDGRLRGEVHRDSTPVIDRVSGKLPELLAASDAEIIIGTAEVLRRLGINQFNTNLKQLFTRHANEGVRASVLAALGDLNDPEIGQYLKKGMQDPGPQVRTAAIGLLPNLDLPESQLAGIVTPIFGKGTTGEQQEMLRTLAAMPLIKSEPPLKKLIEEAAANRIAPEVILDLIEAVESTESEVLLTDLAALKSQGYSTDAYKEVLYGGRWWQGREVFNSNAAAQCVRCHAVDGAGGQVGPALDNIASILSREEILESLIEPSARIAPGYGSVTLNLKDGETVSGLLLEENKNRLLLKTAEAEPLAIPIARIATRTNQPSAMPPMGRIISKRELRDLIEYLSSLKGK